MATVDLVAPEVTGSGTGVTSGRHAAAPQPMLFEAVHEMQHPLGLSPSRLLELYADYGFL